MANSKSIAQPSDENGKQARRDGRDVLYRAGLYEIVIAGHLDKKWSDWLGGMEITHDEAGYTRLTGTIADQSALHGLLVQIRDLGLALVSLNLREIRAGEKDID